MSLPWYTQRHTLWTRVSEIRLYSKPDTETLIEWTNFFATQPQIEQYYTEFAHHYNLEKCTQFGTLVQSCIWDEVNFKWRVTVSNKSTRLTEYWLCDYLSQCVGSLDRPKFGNTPGREDFKGTSWHTAHWRDDVDLTGKTVAIIGCGPSAAQIIPEIIDQVGHLSVYMRNPPVCVPRNDFQYSRWALILLFIWGTGKHVFC